MDEATWHRIHGQLEQLLGSEEAAAIMTVLRVDEQFDQMRFHISSSIAELRADIRAELNQHYRSMLQWTVGAILTAGALGVAIGQLQAG
jgi:hypothetical protein